MAWYVPSKNTKGAIFLRGPYDTEYQAEIKAEEVVGEHTGEPITFPTDNLSRATQMWKESRVGSEGIDEATRRVRHV